MNIQGTYLLVVQRDPPPVCLLSKVNTLPLVYLLPSLYTSCANIRYAILLLLFIMSGRMRNRWMTPSRENIFLSLDNVSSYSPWRVALISNHQPRRLPLEDCRLIISSCAAVTNTWLNLTFHLVIKEILNHRHVFASEQTTRGDTPQ